MRIPKHFRVGGVTYDVEMVENIGRNSMIVGQVDLVNSVIELVDGLSPDTTCKTFLHEMIHTIQEHMGVSFDEDNEKDEAVVDALARGLYMVIQDNPGVFSPNE